MELRRNRFIYAPAVFVVMGAGLLSRKVAYMLPEVVNNYLGDALWALMIYLMAALLFHQRSIKWVAVCSLLFCYSIELSQLYHAPCIDAIRQTRLGGLVLGYGFLWTDLLAYALGITVGTTAEKMLITESK